MTEPANSFFSLSETYVSCFSIGFNQDNFTNKILYTFFFSFILVIKQKNKLGRIYKASLKSEKKVLNEKRVTFENIIILKNKN